MTEDRLVGGWLLTVTEDLLGAGAGRLQQRLLYSPAGHPCLVLDLTAVDRVDSTGMGVLISAVKRLRAGNGASSARPSHAATSPGALHATGLDKVLLLSPDVASALRCDTAPAAGD